MTVNQAPGGADRPINRRKADPLPNPLPGKVRAKHAAQLLGVCEGTLYQWLKDREDFRTEIRRQRIGPRTVLWDTGDILRFIESRSIGQPQSVGV